MNLSISGIRESIVGKQREKTVARSTNPFAAASFKGNVLTADVFESAQNKVEATSKNKLTLSALVGSLSNVGSGFRQRMESVIAFGGRMKEKVVGAWNEMNSIEITFPALDDMRYFLTPAVSPKAVAKMEIADISALLTDNISKLELGAF